MSLATANRFPKRRSLATHPVSRHRFYLLGLGLFLILATLAQPAAAISPEEAIQIVLEEVIFPSPDAERMVGFLYQLEQPEPWLPPGFEITDFDSTFVHVNPEPAYFFWLDNEAGDEWYHTSTFAFVSEPTGQLVTYEARSWPVINGSEHLAFTQLGNDSPDRFYGSYQVSTDVFPHEDVPTPNTDDWVIITVGRNIDGAAERNARVNDINRIKDYVNGSPLGPRVSSSNITTVSGTNTMGAKLSDLCAAMDTLTGGDECEKVYFYYIGHGYSGGVCMMNSDGDGTEKVSYKKLACKLLGLNTKEVCVVIEACHSGSAVRPMKKKKVKVGGKSVGLKGGIVTSSSSGSTTKREPDGTPFHKGMQECGRDPLADFDGNGKVSLFEAIAWARNINELLRGDFPQASGLGDRTSVEFLKTQAGGFVTDETTGVPLTYQSAKFRYKLKRGSSAGRDTIFCVRNLYVANNQTTEPHEATQAVDIVCKRRGKPDTTLVTFTPKLARGQVKCITRIPGDCKKLQILPSGGKITPGLQADAPLLHEELLTGTYLPGEFMLFVEDVDVEMGSGSSYTTDASSDLGWPLALEPLAFGDNGVWETVPVFIRSDVPLDATRGDAITWTIDRQDVTDVLTLGIEALLLVTEPAVIDGDGFYNMVSINAEAGLDLTGGSLTIANSVLQCVGVGDFTTAPNTFLNLDVATVQSDTATTLAMEIGGELAWLFSTVVAPEAGVVFDAASGFVYGGGVFASNGDGLIMRGDFANLEFQFFEIVASAGNGLLAEGADAVLHDLHIEQSDLDDVILRTGSFVHLVDPIFDENKVSVETGSELRRCWTTHLSVKDGEGDPFAGVHVLVTDSLGAEVVDDSTDASGVVEYMILAQDFHDGSGWNSINPHTFRLSFADQETVFTYRALEPEYLIVDLSGSPTTIPDELPLPLQPALAAYPNPFNPQTTLRFELASPTEVRLRVFDQQGRRVRSLVAEARQAGVHEVLWDGRSDAGRRLASGMYFARLEGAGPALIRKVVMIK